MDFNVYVVTNYIGECLYIGSGVRDRYRHVTSGTSHVYELNQMHFSHSPVSVNIAKEFSNKKDALAYEKELIIEKSPRFNKVFNSKVSKIPVEWQMQQKLTMFFAERHVKESRVLKCRKMLKELFQYVKPGVLFESFATITVSDANTDEQRFFRRLNWHMRSRASLVEGSIGTCLSLVLKAESKYTYRFTDEFKEFFLNSNKRPVNVCLDNEKHTVRRRKPKIIGFSYELNSESSILSTGIPNLIGNFLRCNGCTAATEKYCLKTLNSLFKHIKATSLFKDTELPTAKGDLELGLVCSEVRNAVRYRSLFSKNKHRTALNTIIQASSETTIKFTEEFVQFCNNSLDVDKGVDL